MKLLQWAINWYRMNETVEASCVLTVAVSNDMFNCTGVSLVFLLCLEGQTQSSKIV
jgi:hypothetical protein